MTAARIPAAAHGKAVAANDRFARPLVALHWIIAAAIIAMLCIGFYMVGLPRGCRSSRRSSTSTSRSA